MRAVKIAGGAFTLIDESYNANPLSMKAGFVSLGAKPVGLGGRRVVVLTDMLEPSLLTAPPVLTVRGCEVMAELYRTLPAAFDDFCSSGVSLYQGEV